MHDYTVTRLNDHRLAQFDAEATQSRLWRVATAQRPGDRQSVEAPSAALGLSRWIRDHVALALAKVKLRGA